MAINRGPFRLSAIVSDGCRLVMEQIQTDTTKSGVSLVAMRRQGFDGIGSDGQPHDAAYRTRDPGMT